MLPDFADKIKVFAGDVVSAKKPDPATSLKVLVSSADLSAGLALNRFLCGDVSRPSTNWLRKSSVLHQCCALWWRIQASEHKPARQPT